MAKIVRPYRVAQDKVSVYNISQKIAQGQTICKKGDMKCEMENRKAKNSLLDDNDVTPQMETNG